MARKIELKVMCTVLMIMLIISPTRVQASQSRSSYFNKSYTLNGAQEDNLVAVAQAQLRKTKSQLGYTEAWCADFVSDCAKLAGLGSKIPFDGYCQTLYNKIKNAGGKDVASPQKGDIVFYYCKSCSVHWCHVGIMEDPVNSIEGNYGGRVSRVRGHYSDGRHSTDSGVIIRKFVRPAYSKKNQATSPYENPPIYNGVDYGSVYNYDYYIMNNIDIKKAYGDDKIAAFEHFINRGMLEGRRGSEYFDVQFYRAQNLDLHRAYGNDLKPYYLHYINRGRLEGRQGTETISNGVDYSPIYNYEDYTTYNPDIKRVYGNDRIATFQHFLGRGMLEGRRASKKFDVKYYRNNNSDLRRKYGDDLTSYYLHFINRGRLEGRKGVA